MSISSAVIACFFHKREYPAALNTQPLIHLSRALLAVPLYSLLYLPAVTVMVDGWRLAAILRYDEKAARAMHGEVEIIIKARVTIENWTRSGRELSQILTEELLILAIWVCKLVQLIPKSMVRAFLRFSLASP
jgi:hypothetical protein